MRHPLPKQERQKNRKPKNMTKSVRLDIKKYLNRELRLVPKSNLSPNVKRYIIEKYTELRSPFIKS
jgi:hypothetical protein